MTTREKLAERTRPAPVSVWLRYKEDINALAYHGDNQFVRGVPRSTQVRLSYSQASHFAPSYAGPPLGIADMSLPGRVRALCLASYNVRQKSVLTRLSYLSHTFESCAPPHFSAQGLATACLGRM
ncbi:unnamed protein product, partial [Trichogramma brassicae]